MIKVLFICHGNICRSPMAEFIFKDKLEKLGIQDRFEVASAATSTEEIWGTVGNPIYPPAQDELKRRGIGGTPYTDYSNKRAVQVAKSDYAYYDYLLCADAANVRNTMRITGPDTDNKIHMMFDFSDSGKIGRSIADPWYTGNFSDTYNDVCESLDDFLRYLKNKGEVFF